MFGYDYGRQEMVGLDIATLISPLERRNADQETLSAALGAGSWRGELQQRRKDDSTFHASSTFFAIRDESRRTVALASIIRDVTAQKRAEAAQQELQQEIIETQRQTLQELSTPVIPVMDRILVMPMVGNIDSARAKDVTRALLAGISEHRAKFVILDVTGVPIMDSGVVNHLNKTIHAARLKGAYTIVTGIADAVAETIVDLGIDWGAIDARRNLQTGLVTALNKLGFDVIDRQERNITRYGGGR
jgi:rsbT co-antagonist protein RsbR